MLSPSTSGTRGVLKGASWLLNALLLATLLAIGMLAVHTGWVPPQERGEYKSDLRVLRNFYLVPDITQANHVVDMLQMGDFKEFLQIQGLTNNRALFVLSHGTAVHRRGHERYGYYPEQRLCGGKEPCYSAADIAKIIGPEESALIHNVLLAGCNREGAFNSAEVRKHFVNATNITHMPAGNNGYESLFRQALIHPAEGIKVLYQMPNTFRAGEFEEPSAARHNSKKPSPYLAELFTPTAVKPFSTQTASRELIARLPSQLQHSSRAISQSEMARVMNKAIAALHTERTEPQQPSIIMMGGQSSAHKRVLKHRSVVAVPFHSPALAPFSKGLGLPLPASWGETLLTGLLGLAMMRLGIDCVCLSRKRVSVQLQPRPVLTSLLALATLFLTALATLA